MGIRTGRMIKINDKWYTISFLMNTTHAEKVVSTKKVLNTAKKMGWV